MNKISQIFSTFFFIGYIKYFPGTFGSLISLIIIAILFNIINFYLFVLLFFLILVISVFLIKIYSNFINKNDAKEIIIDEFLGIYFVLIFKNNFIFYNELITLSLIFIIFRFFDILKFFPANWVDKNLKNSYGIILDDIIASIYTILTLSIINFFL